MINDKIENNHNVIKFNNKIENQSANIESNKKTIKNSKFFSNVLILILCALISKIIGAIYRVPLLKILGSLGIGQYQMIFSVFSLFLVLSCSGITVAISKLISRETQFNNKKNQKQYVVSGLIITLLESIFFSIIFVFLTPYFSIRHGAGNMLLCYIAIFPSLIIASISSVFKGYFLGKQKMIYSGFSQVFGSVSKLVFSLLFAVKMLPLGISFAVCGALIGSTISEIFSMLILLFFYFKNKKRNIGIEKKLIKKTRIFIKKDKKYCNFCAKRNKILFFASLKDIFKMSFFVKLQSCIFPLVGAIDSIIVVPLLLKTGLDNSVAYSLFGIEDGIVTSLVAMPTIISQSVGQVIVPSLKPNQKNDMTIKNAFKIVWLFGLFCSFVFVAFSKEITNFMYGSGLSNGVINETIISSDLLKMNGFNIIYLSLLGISVSTLQGLGKFKYPIFSLGIATILRYLVLMFCFSNGFGIYSLAVANMSFYVFAMLLNLFEIKKCENLHFSFLPIFVMPICSNVAIILLMKFVQNFFAGLISPKLTLLIILFIGFVLYVMLLVFTKALNIKEICFGLSQKFKHTKKVENAKNENIF